MIKEAVWKERDMDFLPNHPYNNNRFDRVKEKDSSVRVDLKLRL